MESKKEAVSCFLDNNYTKYCPPTREATQQSAVKVKETIFLIERSLNVEEFIVDLEKYYNKRIHCVSHPWRKADLDQNESNLIEISRCYGQKFYEYHKIL